MYGREYGAKELRFEPSGGLLHASLVMQDKETDSYWSIMSGDSLAGPFKGTHLEELPLGVKARFGDWKAAHPDTVVLSVDGVEHVRNNPYDNYFRSGDGFRGVQAEDKRLPTKQSVFAFERGGKAWAVPFEAFEDGAALDVGDETIFLYRPQGEAIFYSTRAYVGAKGSFSKGAEGWTYAPGGARFSTEAASFEGGEGAPSPLDGFDTFWFNWSMIHEGSRILGR